MTAPAAFLEVAVREKRFGRETILSDLALEVAAGEIVGLVGASGCGKSTLLRIIAGLDLRYRGSVALAGHEPRGVTRDIGFVFQEPRLFPWLTVSGNVAFELGLDDRHAHEHPRVTSLLAEVGLSGLERALPKELSGGQAQRVAIARGLFREPRLLLLDEPFSAVDAFTRIRLQALLTEVAIQHAVTVVLVTHDIDEAVFLCDRVAVLDPGPGGIVEQVSVPLGRPRDRGDPRFAALESQLLETLEGLHA